MFGYAVIGAAVSGIAALAALIWAAATYWPVTLGLVVLAVVVAAIITSRRDAGAEQADHAARVSAVDFATTDAMQEIEQIKHHTFARMERIERLRWLR